MHTTVNAIIPAKKSRESEILNLAVYHVAQTITGDLFKFVVMFLAESLYRISNSFINKN